MLRKILITPSNHFAIQLIRYGFVVSVATPIDFGVYILLVELGLHVVLAATIAFTVSIIVNFQLSMLWVFSRHNSQQKHIDAAVFMAIGIIGLILTDIIIWVMASRLSVNYVIAKAIALVSVFFWNFTARRKFFAKAAKSN